MESGTSVLDLLFDQSEGILKEDHNPGIEPVDFSTLDLMTGDFDEFLFDGVLLSDEKKSAPQISAYTDHDYVMQPVQSPASSDSGVSLESGNSPRAVHEDSAMSGSPGSVSQFSPQMLAPSPDTCINSEQMSHSPGSGNQSGLDALELENFDFGDISNMNFDTLDTSALAENSQADRDLLDEDVSIDLGNHSDLMTFGTSTNIHHNADGSETKTIKIIKVSASGTLPFTMKDVSTDVPRPGIAGSPSFPELRLTEEEKDLLAREGVNIPTNMPLTKEEERQLKGIRRKIRNKVSAKESRKRKMDYVDGLEKRVKLCTQENQSLNKKVDSLEKRNMTLMSQLKKLQSLINLRSTKTAQASTCLMVLLLSFAFLIVPNFNPMGGDGELDDLKSIPMPGNSRNLLHKGGEELGVEDAGDNPYGITIRPGPFWEFPPKTPAVQDVSEKPSGVAGDADKVMSDVGVGFDADMKSVPEDDSEKENVIYVQIEKDVGVADESNVTYVFSESEYKKGVDQPGPSKEGGSEQLVDGEVKKRKQDPLGGEEVKKRKQDL